MEKCGIEEEKIREIFDLEIKFPEQIRKSIYACCVI